MPDPLQTAGLGKPKPGMSRKIKIIVGVVCGVIGFVVLVGSIVLYATRGLVTAADTFFSQIASGDTKVAFESTSEQFGSEGTLKDFEAFVKAKRITEYVSGKWTERSVKNNIGKLEGNLVLKDGGTLPIILNFVKEDGQWKIYGFNLLEAEASEIKEKTIPSDVEINNLVKDSLVSFGQAIKKHDFTDFYNNSISESSKTRITPEKFQEIFGDMKISEVLSQKELETKKPILIVPPAIKDNQLVIKGYYSTKDYDYTFKLGYEYEYPNWKLVSIGVNDSLEELRKE